jgi:hypothetical protein
MLQEDRIGDRPPTNDNPRSCDERHRLLPHHAGSAPSQHEFLHFTRRGLRKLVDDADPLRCLEMGQTVADVTLELFLGGSGAIPQYHEGMGRFTPSVMWHADDRDFLYRRVTQEAAFDLNRRDVFTPAYDNVLETVSDFHVSVRMHDRRVAGVKPTISNRRVRRLRVVV